MHSRLEDVSLRRDCRKVRSVFSSRLAGGALEHRAQAANRPWDQFAMRTGGVRPFWHPIMWLYENLDNAKFDEYMTESLPRWEPKIKSVAAQAFETDAREAVRRNLPAALDEGGHGSGGPNAFLQNDSHLEA